MEIYKQHRRLQCATYTRFQYMEMWVAKRYQRYKRQRKQVQADLI